MTNAKYSDRKKARYANPRNNTARQVPPEYMPPLFFLHIVGRYPMMGCTCTWVWAPTQGGKPFILKFRNGLCPKRAIHGLQESR